MVNELPVIKILNMMSLKIIFFENMAEIVNIRQMLEVRSDRDSDGRIICSN